jgi:hypothetical protein
MDRVHLHADGSGIAALGWDELDESLRGAVAGLLAGELGGTVTVDAVRLLTADGLSVPVQEGEGVVIVGFHVEASLRRS